MGEEGVVARDVGGADGVEAAAEVLDSLGAAADGDELSGLAFADPGGFAGEVVVDVDPGGGIDAGVGVVVDELVEEDHLAGGAEAGGDLGVLVAG
jgi:hypothetical protein